MTRGYGMISFEEASGRGRGRHIVVKFTTKLGEDDAGHEGPEGKTLTVTIGRIECSRDGMFRYFEPEASEPDPTLVDKDLEALKKRIRAHSKR